MSLIDRNSPKPIHTQLTEIMTERIVNGIYPVNSRLPSEREICEEFEVSRTTVREMLRQLKGNDLVYVLAGRGAFVKAPQRDIEVNISLNGFSLDLQRIGKNPSSDLLGAEVVASTTKKIADALHINPGEEAVKIERLRFDNNKPLAIHTAWLNHRLCPQILQYNLAQSSLFTILRTDYQLVIQKATQKVYASLANAHERKLLSLPTPSAVLHAERITYLDTGEVIEYSIATYCGDFYHLVIDLDAQSENFNNN